MPPLTTSSRITTSPAGMATLRLLLLAALVSFFAAGAALVGFPYLVREVLGLTAELYGAAESALSE